MADYGLSVVTDVVPILRVDDAVAAVDWYRRLGFHQVFEHRFEPHLPAYVGIRCEGAQLHLSEHLGDATPGTLLYVWVDDVDTIAREFAVAVVEVPWGREVALLDLDGNRLRITQRMSSPDTDTVLGDGVTETLIDLERAMWAEATRGDRPWMDERLSDSFTEFGWSGVAYTRAEILAAEIGPIDATLENFAVRPVGRDAAMVTYRSVQQRGAGNRASLWVRNAGRWLLEFHQGTPSP